MWVGQLFLTTEDLAGKYNFLDKKQRGQIGCFQTVGGTCPTCLVKPRGVRVSPMTGGLGLAPGQEG